MSLGQFGVTTGDGVIGSFKCQISLGSFKGSCFRFSIIRSRQRSNSYCNHRKLGPQLHHCLMLNRLKQTTTRGLLKFLLDPFINFVVQCLFLLCSGYRGSILNLHFLVLQVRFSPTFLVFWKSSLVHPKQIQDRAVGVMCVLTLFGWLCSKLGNKKCSNFT